MPYNCFPLIFIVISVTQFDYISPYIIYSVQPLLYQCIDKIFESKLI